MLAEVLACDAVGARDSKKPQVARVVSSLFGSEISRAMPEAFASPEICVVLAPGGTKYVVRCDWADRSRVELV